jgi:NAD(P)-dependent dehydrogenase (short-subunit alcohol dehydrogenase family)
LGATLAERAAALGHAVALLGRDTGRLEEARARAAAKGVAATAHAVDLRDEAATARAMGDVFAAHGAVRALVNCAATWTGGKEVRELSSAAFRSALDANFFVALHPILALLGAWERGDVTEGAIVNVGATASLRGGAKSAAFAVPKSALRVLSQSLAKELGPRGIHVAHVVVDGLLDNDRTRALNPGLPAERYLSSDALADGILRVIAEPKSCWTFEWDARPFNERF